ncbi:DnaD domain protein [Paenibacillus larvae]|uniref:DNA damage-inducible protein n=6 Tax=root TaxID=1 RepID=A0A0K2CZ53_9CAUD|nr:DnaD domain protein [Paenibacillus larvae]ALA12626.1 DNA damage-inducible protein [Paenibacillus phage Paisley]QVV19458.1 DnaD domain protein [Paenibacillus phage Bert]QVV19859.1 DnaD domain protein [Paenibacillus phage Mock2]UYL93248.1 DnaD domain protein [Paenibacillus phage Callan]UYL93325.1 DnaD domain protein [Paenibacillus phage Dash]UYL93399.1 DnaD domain protein [Paenibacillus phage Lilo]
MAEKRMISKVISISEKVNMLPDIFDMLLFTWMIPHTDDFGRMVGSPAKVKALVVPMLDKTVRNVEEALGRLAAAGLILWYEAEGEKIIQILNFEKHQQGLHKRTKSKFPDYIPDDSGNFRGIPSEQNRTEEKRTEENRTELEQISGSRSRQEDPFRMFEHEGFGMLSPVLADRLKDMCSEYGDRWVCEAMKKAVVKGKRNLGYVDGILKNWRSGGIDEPWKEEQHEESGGRSKGSRPGKNKAASGGTESEFAYLAKAGRS